MRARSRARPRVLGWIEPGWIEQGWIEQGRIEPGRIEAGRTEPEIQPVWRHRPRARGERRPVAPRPPIRWMSSTSGSPSARRRRSLEPLRRSSSAWPLVLACATAASVALGIVDASAQDQATPAAPDPAEEAVAQSLFEAGRSLMAEGQIEEACAKFEESNRIAPSAGTTLNLGKCLEAQGKTASAWAAYKRGIGLARATGQARHAAAGESFVADIEPRLSTIRVETPDPLPGLVVRRGGTALGAAALGVPLAVDPGEHLVEASAPGRVPWSTTVVVPPGGGAIVVEVPELAVEPTRPPPRPPPPDPVTTPEPVAAGADLRLIGFAVGGGGVVVLGVGAVFGVMTLSDASAAEDDPALCPRRRCTAAGEDAIADAEAKAWVSNVAIGLGAAAIVTGGVLVGLSILDDEPPARGASRWSPWASATGAGVVVEGTL